MREFDTGATRDTVEDKFDFEGFLSPAVLNRYAEYMNKHRIQADGELRDSDNWQKGIPLKAYMKSAYRHFFDWWANHRHVDEAVKENIEESLCGLLFNTMGYLHEYLKVQSDEYNAVEIDGPISCCGGRITSDKSNMTEVDKPKAYAPQPGDVVSIKPRVSMSSIYKLRIKQVGYVGTVVVKLDSPANIYKVHLAFHVDVNLYSDELILLERKGA